MAFEKIISGSGKLPTLPGIAIKILEAVQKERPELKEIAGVLSTDPPLSAEVLKLINSPFFGLHRKVTSVFHAVSMLGMNVVKNMALSFALVKNFSSDEKEDFDYPRFWKYSLTTAIAAQEVAKTIFRGNAEDAFFLGLLHDMGRLTLARCLPDQYHLVGRLAEANGDTWSNAESEILGFDHMAVGAYLVKTWGLPAKFWMPIQGHHHAEDPEECDEKTRCLFRVLHLAVLYADMLDGEGTAKHLARIDQALSTCINSQTIDADHLAIRIAKEASRFFPSFEIDFKDEAAYHATIERARAELINASTESIDQLILQQRQIDVLQRAATHDGMTQLMNYQYFHETLGREIARSQRSKTVLTLVMADIDRFKQINDTYGHPAGDHAIKTVALCLKANLRETDHIARYGGEEFTVILYHIPPEEVFKVMERVRLTLSDLPITFDGQSFKISMSFGIATMNYDETMDKEDLIVRADKALYRAKSAGRNCCCIYGQDAEVIRFPVRRFASGAG